MSVEIPVDDDVEGSKSTNGTSVDYINGVQNGYSSSDKHKSSHKSSSKDKHRDKDRDHRNSSSKHGSSSGRDKDKHSSSKDHRSSHKSSNRDKERSDKDRGDKSDKSRDRSDKVKERSDKDKDRSDKDKVRSDKDKERSDKTERDKEKSDIDKHRSDKDKGRSEKGGERDRKERDKNDISKSSEKDRKSSSSKDHKSSSSSKDHKSSKSSNDKHRSDKDKHRHSSSSSKEKHRSSSSGSKDKADRKEKSTNEQEKELLLPHKDSSKKKDDFVLKQEPESQPEVENLKKEIVKKEEDLWDTSVPNGEQFNSTASSCDYSLSQFKDEPQDDIKMEVDSEEDIPLSSRLDKKRKAEPMSDSDEEIPLSDRKQSKGNKKAKVKKESDYDDEYSDEDAPKAKKKKKKQPDISKSKESVVTSTRKKKQAEPEEVWKWWEEEKKQDGTKWTFLEHKGPVFAPEYEKLPDNVVFRYNGKVIKLSQDTEEVAGFYARMLDHDYTTKKVFNDNFFGDWRKVMTSEELSIIKDLKLCDFKTMNTYFTAQSEKNRNRTKEEKAVLKAKNEEIQKEYGFCTIDGHKEKIGNFRIEPPGLFRGRGEHPKMGMLKKRVLPMHVSINCSKDSKQPQAPNGHKWKDVRHDNAVTWLASWTENVQGQVKYVMLNPSSKLKGEKDWQKYETARKLHKKIDKIRETYRDEWKAKEMRVRQRAVALYFIDKLALRAGNEKDEDQADTVGCCSLRVEHITLHQELDGKEHVVVFDFLGKDSIRYYNEVEVEKRVFKNLELFKENKKGSDDLFDRLNTQILNDHLRDLMPGLTAKVFRTYNASITLQRQLDNLTDADYSLAEKILAYNRANRAVAILCNHQRAVPKTHQKSMQALKEKISLKHEQIDEAEAELGDLQKAAKRGSVKEKMNADKKKKALEKLRDQLKKLEVQETDRDENKSIALGTSKLNYLDPRISVAWCKKHDVPLEKIYNKTQRDKFRWAIDMADSDYIF